MRDYYARWQQTPRQGKGEALREAQRALLGFKTFVPESEKRRGMTLITSDGKSAPPFIKDSQHPYSHPFYWAPFTMVGNWR
jgi:CHAT domain-containing protein